MYLRHESGRNMKGALWKEYYQGLDQYGIRTWLDSVVGCQCVKPVMESVSPCHKELQPKNFISLSFARGFKCPMMITRMKVCRRLYSYSIDSRKEIVMQGWKLSVQAIGYLSSIGQVKSQISESDMLQKATLAMLSLPKATKLTYLHNSTLVGIYLFMISGKCDHWTIFSPC